jgi:DNA repair photolyase
MNINEICCKTALSASSLPGLDYSMNPYRGCQHNCAYCYVPNVLRIPRYKWGSFVDVRTNMPVILSKEVKKKKPGVVGISTVTDPYQPVEKKYRLTRYCLEQLLRYGFPVCIQTKSSLVERDMDIISRFSNAEIMMSIGTIKEDVRELLEPNASSVEERLNTLRQFSDIGLKTSVFFGPIYPNIRIQDITRIIDIFIESGADDIMIDRLNLKPGILENVDKRLSSEDRLRSIFRKHLLEGDFYYQKLFDKIINYSNKKNIRILFAFK